MALSTRKIIIAALAAGEVAAAGYAAPATFGSAPAANGTAVLADDDGFVFDDDDEFVDDYRRYLDEIADLPGLMRAGFW